MKVQQAAEKKAVIIIERWIGTIKPIENKTFAQYNILNTNL